ncbi:MAG: GNAT family N-acetyltransferase [Actinomycetes bacterium]
MPIIRELTADDLDVMLAINQENVPAVGPETSETMQQIFEWSSLTLGIEVDQALVGYCLIMKPGLPYASTNYQWFCDKYDEFIYLDRVAFTESHQGRGYGSLLYNEVEARSTESLFTLEVNLKPRNEGSLRFHERLGFVEVGQQISGSGKLVSLMAKTLR